MNMYLKSICSSITFMGKEQELLRRKFPFQIFNSRNFTVTCLFCHQIAVSVIAVKYHYNLHVYCCVAESLCHLFKKQIPKL